MAKERTAAENVYVMAMLRSAFSKNQIIVAVLLVYVRFFRVTTTQAGTKMVNLAHLLPVDKVFAVEYRDSGEILERAVDQIEIIASPAN